MKTCRTCKHWKKPAADANWTALAMCGPIDPDTREPMPMGYEVRLCQHPSMTFCETPTERNGFGIADASTYMALLATAEEFGCVRHTDRPSSANLVRVTPNKPRTTLVAPRPLKPAGVEFDSPIVRPIKTMR